jgi:putative nucleotidyltransferase with HDIG domain
MNCSPVLDQNPVFREIGQIADHLGMETYVVGGFVRDHFLQRKDADFDIDIVTVGSGIQLARHVAEHYGKLKRLNVFKNFGTAMFRLKHVQIEFVGARKESYNRNSRKPVVEDGTLQDDQNRRDFTINTMAFGLNKVNYGELIDPFNGMHDLKRKQIRTPLDPDITFSDDPLRMMRGIRFAAQLNFDITPDTFDAIIKNADRIKIVSQERITSELEKVILSDHPSYGFKLLFHSGLLKIIFPEMVNLQGVDKIDGRAHKDNFYHTLQVLDNVAAKSNDLWLRWGAIMHDIAKPVTKRYDEQAGWTFHGHEEIGARMVPKLFKKLKLPMNEKMRFVQKLVRLHLRPIALVSSQITDSAVRRLIFEAGDDIDKLMILCKADVTSKNPEKVNRYLSNFNKVEQKISEVEARDKIRNFQPPIRGEEIMRIFNLPPGREIGIIKNEIKEAILDGKIENNHDAAERFMLEIGKKLGLKSEI